MGPEGSLPHSQVPATCPYPEPHPTSWRSILTLISHLHLGLPSCLFPSGFPTKILYSKKKSILEHVYILCFLSLILRSWSSLLRYNCPLTCPIYISMLVLSRCVFWTGRKCAATFLRCAKLYQTKRFTWFANLAAFFSTSSNESIWPYFIVNDIFTYI